MIKRPTFTFEDALLVGSLLKDPRLTFNERGAIGAALKRIEELETEKSWRDPYAAAISVLEQASRASQGSFG